MDLLSFADMVRKIVSELNLPDLTYVISKSKHLKVLLKASTVWLLQIRRP